MLAQGPGNPFTNTRTPMTKSWVLAACLITGAAWAQPGTALDDRPPETGSAPPSVSLWVQPLSLLTLTPIAASEGDTLLMLPVGANFALGSRTDLVLELTPLLASYDCEARCKTQGLAVAVGPSWTVVQTRPGSGFFVQPKLLGVLTRDSREVDFVVPGDAGSWSETGRQLSLGLDVGYRMTRGHFFMAFVLGGSVGRGWNVPQASDSLFFALLDTPQRAREDKSVWDINLNLVRIGGSF